MCLLDDGARVLVIAGEDDSIIPPEQSRRVADAAGAEFVLVPSAGHNDHALGAGEAVVDAIVATAHEGFPAALPQRL